MSDIEQLSLGAVLKKRREDLHLSVQDIADKTRIRVPLLQAMEEDRFDDFPGDTYLCGFLKNVAEVLALDAQNIIRQFRQQTGTPVGGHKKGVSDYAVPSPPLPKTGQPALLRLTLVLLAGLILGGAYWLSYRSFSIPSSEEEVSPRSSVLGESSLSERMAAIESTPSVAAVETSVSPNDPPMLPVESLISVTGSVLRVEALREVQIEIRIDQLPIKQYSLVKGAILSWRVSQSASLQISGPEEMHIWLDDQLLDLQGRSELQLRSAQFLDPVER